LVVTLTAVFQDDMGEALRKQLTADDLIALWGDDEGLLKAIGQDAAAKFFDLVEPEQE